MRSKEAIEEHFVSPDSAPALVLFDFDGTITICDTLLAFIIFCRGRVRFTIGLFVMLPFILLYKFKVKSASWAKQWLMKYFFGGMSSSVFKAWCHAFVVDKIPGLVRATALAQIREHQMNCDRVIIVSASPEDWVGEWARLNGVEWIATRLAKRKGVVTGRFRGANCNGMEKVRRIKSCLNLAEYPIIYAYGDTRDDLPMLNLATVPHFKPFQ